MDRPESEVPERYRCAFAAVEQGATAASGGGPYRQRGSASALPPFETLPFAVERSHPVVGYGCALLLPGSGLAVLTLFLARSAVAPLERVQGSRLDELLIGGMVWLVLLVVALRVASRVRREYRARRAFERGAYGYYLFEDALVVRQLDHCTVLPRAAVRSAHVTSSLVRPGEYREYATVVLAAGIGPTSYTLPQAGDLSLEQLRQRVERWIARAPSQT
ncbi:MAG: hypothetical protein JRI23_01610 [Deltaproteobacteria bacterium]|nr:hypothetical protein [Deltaproteobacteria bacterium]MBW2530163.1 hypothetical protein [Deltaproteobacteria bacterium]